MSARRLRRVTSWMRNRRGSASIEFVIGAVVIVLTTVAALDLYRLANARVVSAHAAVTMADYLARETSPAKALIDDLANFSHHYQIALPSQAVFVVSSVGRPAATEDDPDPSVQVLWNYTTPVTRIDDDGEEDLSCGQIGEKGQKPSLLDDFVDAVALDEFVIVAEVCVALASRAFLTSLLSLSDWFGWSLSNWDGTTFSRRHVLPMRDEQAPDPPKDL